MSEAIRVICDKQDIIAIADAVRNKTGLSDSMNLGGIVSGINGLSTKYTEATNAVAQFGSVTYKSVQKALDDAKVAGGGTVTLIANAEEDGVAVHSGVMLDLNGYTLIANSVVGYDNSHIIDGSGGSGVLKCSQTILNKTNSQMPVWNAVDGYVFGTMKHQTKAPTVVDNTFSVKFRPAFGTNLHTLYFGNGAEDNQISMNCLFEWETEDGTYKQSYQYKDELIANAYGNNQTFIFNVTNVDAFPNYKVRLNVISDTGVSWIADFN